MEQEEKKFVYDVFTHGFTQSMLTAFRTCPIKARMTTEGWRLIGNEGLALIFGNIYHGYQETVLTDLSKIKAKKDRSFSNIDWDDVGTRVFATMQDDYDKASPEVTEHFELGMGMAEVVMPRYFKHWEHLYCGRNANFTPVALELEFCVDLGLGIPFRGKIDGILKDKKGKIWLLEHKTKSSISSDEILMTIPRDIQTILYSVAIKEIYGEFPAGILYNVTRRPGLRRSAKETMPDFIKRIAEDVDLRPDWYFMMFEIVNSEADVLRNFELLKQDIKRFRGWALQAPENDPPYSHSCIQMTYNCQYLQYCASGKTDTAYLTRSVLFPELDEANKVAETTPEKGA